MAALSVRHPVLEIDTPIDRHGAAPTDREGVEALLGSVAREVVVFCGHYHVIDETCEADIRQFATPAISCQVVRRADRVRVDARTFGYRTVEFDGADVRTRCVVLTDSA